MYCIYIYALADKRPDYLPNQVALRLPDKHLNGTLHFKDKPYLLEQISTQASKACLWAHLCVPTQSGHVEEPQCKPGVWLSMTSLITERK